MTIKEDDRDRITEAGAVIASWTRVWSQLLVVHVAGQDGRCRGCPGTVHAAPRWPCRLAELAGAARSAHSARCRGEQDATLQRLPGPRTPPRRG
jgi:hypothetical protein